MPLFHFVVNWYTFFRAGEFYVTSKRYVAVEDDELTFDIGVNLQIIEKNFDGWWKAS